MKQTILLMTFFYDPALVDPTAFTAGAEQVSEAALLSQVRHCLAQGGMVCTSRTEAEMIHLIPDETEPALGHDWVALTFLPLAPCTAPGEPFVMLETEAPIYAP